MTICLVLLLERLAWMNSNTSTSRERAAWPWFEPSSMDANFHGICQHTFPPANDALRWQDTFSTNWRWKQHHAFPAAGIHGLVDGGSTYTVYPFKKWSKQVRGKKETILTRWLNQLAKTQVPEINKEKVGERRERENCAACHSCNLGRGAIAAALWWLVGWWSPKIPVVPGQCSLGIEWLLLQRVSSLQCALSQQSDVAFLQALRRLAT